MRAKKVEKDEGMVDCTATQSVPTGDGGYVFLKGGTYDMPKLNRRNGRISWKQRALAAESEAQVYLWVGLLLTVASFFIGVNVGLYAF